MQVYIPMTRCPSPAEHTTPGLHFFWLVWNHATCANDAVPSTQRYIAAPEFQARVLQLSILGSCVSNATQRVEAGMTLED